MTRRPAKPQVRVVVQQGNSEYRRLGNSLSKWMWLDLVAAFFLGYGVYPQFPRRGGPGGEPGSSSGPGQRRGASRSRSSRCARCSLIEAFCGEMCSRRAASTFDRCSMSRSFTDLLERRRQVVNGLQQQAPQLCAEDLSVRSARAGRFLGPFERNVPRLSPSRHEEPRGARSNAAIPDRAPPESSDSLRRVRDGRGRTSGYPRRRTDDAGDGGAFRPDALALEPVLVLHHAPLGCTPPNTADRTAAEPLRTRRASAGSPRRRPSC